MIANILYSIAGLIIGFSLGWWLRCERKAIQEMLTRKKHVKETATDVRPRGDADYDPTAAIPTVIPAVKFDPSTGEPLIAKEEVHHPSPIPRSIAIILIVLACVSVGYLFWQKAQDADALKRANDRLATQTEANTALIAQLRHQQGIIDANEKRLEDLVLAISTAKTPGQVTEAIQRFLKSSARAHEQEQQYQQRNGGGASGSGSSYSPGGGDTGGSSASPQPSSSPQPSPSHSPSAKPSPSPSQSPNPPVQVCVTTPRGRVCEPTSSLLPSPLFII